MILFSLFFLAGDLYLQTFSHLPDLRLLITLNIVSVIIYFCLHRYMTYTFVLIAFMFGMLYSAWFATAILSWTLPSNFIATPVAIIGHVVSIPVEDKGNVRFVFELEQMQAHQQHYKTHALFMMSWYRPNQSLKVGDKWKLIARLKPIYGIQNPGAFDFEAWALQRGLRASGYVLSKVDNQLLSHHWYIHPIDQLRQYICETTRRIIGDSKVLPWLTALMVGERAGATQADWQVLRNTGTNHLMAIGGLHIGVVAGFTYIIICFLWRRVTCLTLYLPAIHAGACAAFLMAFLYSLLSGFALPTQRACIMLGTAVFILLSNKKTNAWQAWSFALMGVLLLNPLSVLTESFWLSFATIALIIYGMHARLAPKGWWWKWGRVQWVIGIGLIPLSLYLFQEGSLLSFFANCIAIPWLSFLILPFCLLGCVLLLIYPAWSAGLLFIAHHSLMGLWFILNWLSHISFASWHHAIPNEYILAMGLVGIILLLLPAGLPGRILSIIWLLPLLFYAPAQPKRGDIWLTMLDVGQGLSVLVQTQHHLLIYDAGPHYPNGSDMGERVILPYLRKKISASSIDMLVISHGDNDHIGGAFALLKAIPIKRIKTSVPEMLSTKMTSYCLAGERWEWDGVYFSFIYPTKFQLGLTNDSSCVLRIENGEHAILLTGDIEKYAERYLLKHAKSWLSASIVSAPHHGSKSSGLPAFLEAIHPQFVLYATGYLNRYHFPHQQVVSTYTRLGVVPFNTAETGTIQFKIVKGQTLTHPDLYRISHARYWYTAFRRSALQQPATMA